MFFVLDCKLPRGGGVKQTQIRWKKVTCRCCTKSLNHHSRLSLTFVIYLGAKVQSLFAKV